MAKKQFKAESKRLLDLMINSIYTHKEIFLRELISNASDALDKLYYRELTEHLAAVSRDDFAIRLKIDKEARTLTIEDNGCGMTPEQAGAFVAHTAMRKGCKPIRTIGLQYKFFHVLSRILPCRLLNWLVGLLYAK